ncbi:G2/mitotic-specific cyclin S13-7-like isoform X2 [Olea europaea var. sylvestris]|uniref:G2/mitotic-specific cyclin S13-7-like isoform X2 n=1 Tax=Olea europaea var. sylvestris TaxID=158386 RepID=UPI000C1D890D|nr:G2/mitotic-specific cyclin S13-7-like isoform X2 [Olea europaea var. sylvestris]
MASRLVVQQENRGEALPGGVKQKNMAAERKNRPALTNIGNRVTIPGVEGKPVPKVSRPVTRSFRAQLLANAQAAAAENKKNALIANGALPNQKAMGRKEAQKKAIVKPRKPEEIVEISPDTEEIVEKDEAQKKATVKPKKTDDIINISHDTAEVLKKDEPVKQEKAGEGSSKKKAPTLTSTLTARSKAACGLSKKPKEQIVDIDAADVNNDLAAVEYVEEIYKYYKSVENESRVNYYIDSQPEINEKMRAILIDWLIQVHHKFELSPETLYLTINIVDRYLATKTTLRKELQLLGISAMLIASKYEEIWAPEVNDLVCISDRAYSNEQVLAMEKRILGELEWNLTVPTLYVFLVRFIKASLTDSDVENAVYFLAELGMMNYVTLMYCPSMIAASAVYAARCTLNKAPFWNETLKLHTGFSELQLTNCAKLLVSFHSVAAEHNLKTIYRKYSSEERGAVALLPPAKFLTVA